MCGKNRRQKLQNENIKACSIPQGGHDNINTVGSKYQKVSTHSTNTTQHKSLGIAEMGDRLTTTGMGQRLGAMPLWRRESWVLM